MPHSTRPHRLRRSTVPKEIIIFIKEMRERYPRIGKERLKPLLDRYCKEKGLRSVSKSTIGNIIKRHRFFYQKTGRLYHNPDSKWAGRNVNKKRRLKIKHPLRPEDLGHIVSETVERVSPISFPILTARRSIPILRGITGPYRRNSLITTWI